MRQRESSKNRAHEQLSKQTADRCEGARLLMREEKKRARAIQELNMMKHASSIQSTKKNLFCEEKKTYSSRVSQAELLGVDDVKGTWRRNKLAERWG